MKLIIIELVDSSTQCYRYPMDAEVTHLIVKFKIYFSS